MLTDSFELNKNRFLLGILLNTLYAVIEFYYGFLANSVALVADAIHNASDVLGLGVAWFSYYLAQQRSTVKFTYGFKNVTIFASFINSIILIIAVGNLMYVSFMRLISPEIIVPSIVVWVAAFGVVMNAGTAWLFYAGRQQDLNILGAYLNMALDALLSLAVVIGGIFIWWFDWYLLDPLLGILIAATIIYSIWNLFRESLHLVLLAVPNTINLQAVINDIHSFPEIIEYHDLHVWAMSTTQNALSVHIITAEKDFNPELTSKLATIFREKYNIIHSTIQLEVAGSEKSCILHC